MKRKRKKTPEARAAERAYQEDLTRRLKATIDRYRRMSDEGRRSGDSPA
jgi:hypothetical protein